MSRTRRAGLIIGLISSAVFAFPFSVSADFSVVYDFPNGVWGAPNGAFVGGSILGPGSTNTDTGGAWDPVAKDFSQWLDSSNSYSFSQLDLYLGVVDVANPPTPHPISAGTVRVNIYAADDSWNKTGPVASSNPLDAATLSQVNDQSVCIGTGTAANPYSSECIASFSFSPTVLAAGQRYIFEIEGDGIISTTNLNPFSHRYDYAGLSIVGANVFVPPYGNGGIQRSPNPNTGSVYMRLSSGSATPPPPGNSSVLFLPGIEGSLLKEASNTVWPPSVWSRDVARLALTDTGESVNDIKVIEVLNDFYSVDLYGGFAAFMNGLVADGTIHEWKPFAYDWRFSPNKIISEGVKTPNGVIDPIQTIEQLAANSPSGKVTIVAHSMGGLLGKALIEKLQSEGKDNLIDSFVMIGSPQLGTPQAIPSLLHGEQPLMLEVFVRSSITRSVAQNMQSAYDLLPSDAYFAQVGTSTISFDPNASYTQAWRNQWTTIDTYGKFAEFLTGTGVIRSTPQITDLGTPEVLDSGLLNTTRELHQNLDNYTVPSHIRVVQVAGWGLPTTKAVTYWNAHALGLPTPIRSYKIVPTIEGDQTVVYPSAIATAGERYFFNLALFNNKDDGHDFDHKDLLGTDPIQSLIETVIENGTISINSYLLSHLPSVSDVPEQLLIITRSPVVIGAYDNQGNFTGINSNQDLGSETLLITKGIPGSNFLASGENQYLFLPKGMNYTLKFKGTGSGPASIETSSFVNDEIHAVSGFTDIAVTPSTSAVFTVDADTFINTSVQIDQNGDGQVDVYIAPDGGVLSLENLLANLKTAVNGLSTTKPAQKTQLLNKIANIETKIAKQKAKQTNTLAKLKAQVEKKAGKGKIDTATANSLSALLDDLISQSAVFPIDSALIQQLKEQITAANITVALKNSLLAKVARIESLAGVNRSLDSMTKAVQKKGVKGVLTDTETQNLLNLLDQIQAAI